MSKEFEAKHQMFNVTLYVPCYQKNPDGRGDDFPGYPTFEIRYSEASQDQQMVAMLEPDYILELNGTFDAMTQPFSKKVIDYNRGVRDE